MVDALSWHNNVSRGTKQPEILVLGFKLWLSERFKVSKRNRVILWCRLHVFSFERIDKARIHVPIPKLSNIVKGELRPEISRLYMKVLTLIKVMFFFDMCNAAAACEDRKPKYWRLWRRHLGLSLTLWRHTVKHDILIMVCDCQFPCSCVYWSLVKARKIVWQSQVIDSSSIAQLECVQIQHCTYQRKTLLFAFRPQSPFNN